MSNRTWDSLTEEERQAAIKEHSRFLDPVQARKNWEAGERRDEANRAASKKAAFRTMVSGWRNETGDSIPKTVDGIELHKELVARVRSIYPRIRLNIRNIQRRYKVIRQTAEDNRKNVETAERFAKEKRDRAEATAAHEARQEAEKAARIEEEAEAALKQAREDLERLPGKVLYYQKALSVRKGQIARLVARIAEIETVLPSYVGSSLYYKMKALVPPLRRRLAYYTAKLTQYQGLLGSNQSQLTDAEAFLQSKGVLPQPKESPDSSPAVDSRVIDLAGVKWTRRGKFLVAIGLVIPKVKKFDIWVRSSGTGKLRIFSDQPLLEQIDWVVFGKGENDKKALITQRKGFFCADLSVDQVTSLTR